MPEAVAIAAEAAAEATQQEYDENDDEYISPIDIDLSPLLA